MSRVEIRVPSIRNFKDVNRIATSVHPGDIIDKRSFLVKRERDKALIKVVSTYPAIPHVVTTMPGLYTCGSPASS
ncbi:hypothetical protein GJV44_00596 [Candidatus Vallotia cooleyia]|nr:hypothetical protein GJV44_00596 [Candidatus Vallotia cooleyia]